MIVCNKSLPTKCKMFVTITVSIAGNQRGCTGKITVLVTFVESKARVLCITKAAFL